MTTRDNLIRDLQTDAQTLADTVARIPEDGWNDGVYEHGWSARQLLAHIAAIEWTYPKLIERAAAAQTAETAEAADPASSFSSNPAVTDFDMDAYNHRQVEKRGDTPIPDLLAEFQRNRQATIAAIQAAPDAILTRPTRSAGGVEGTLLEVLAGVARTHVRQHLTDLTTAAPPTP